MVVVCTRHSFVFSLLLLHNSIPVVDLSSLRFAMQVSISLITFAVLFLLFFASLCWLIILPSCNVGSVPRTILLNNNSAGGTFAVLCGVVLYSKGSPDSSCCHFFPPAITAVQAYFSGCIKRSTSALPCGHFGVEGVKLNTEYFQVAREVISVKRRSIIRS